jgi:hypothetical protein
MPNLARRAVNREPPEPSCVVGGRCG